MKAVGDCVAVESAFDQLIYAGAADWAHQRNRVLIRALHDQLEVATFSGDAWSVAHVNGAHVSLEGAAVVPSKPVLSFVRSCPRPALFEVEEARDLLKMQCDGARLQLATYPLESWTWKKVVPLMSASIPSEWFQSLNRVVYAAHSTDPLLQCVRWGDGHIMASDHYRLAMRSDAFGLQTFLLPATIWQHVLKHAKGDVEIEIDDSAVRFTSGSVEYTALRVLASYGDRASVVRHESRYELQFSTDVLKHVLRSTSFMDADRRVRIDYSGGTTARVSASRDGYGSVEAELTASGSFRGALLLDVSSLSDVLAHLVEQTVRLEIQSDREPIVMHDRDATHVVMPYPV